MADRKRTTKLPPLTKDERNKAVAAAIALNAALDVKQNRAGLVEWLREIAEYHRIEGDYPGTVFTICHLAADELER